MNFIEYAPKNKSKIDKMVNFSYNLAIIYENVTEVQNGNYYS